MSRERLIVVPDDPHELTKLIVDYYKHLSTLSGAGIIVMLTIFREDVLDRILVSYAVVLFALAILACLFGYGLTLALFNRPFKIPENAPVPLPLTALAATFLFAQAIISSLITFGLNVASFATLGLLITGAVIVILWILCDKLISPWQGFRSKEPDEQ